MRHLRRRPLVVSLALAAACSRLAAQQPVVPAEPQDTFFEEIQVGIAEIEVVVTDRDGHRITDLTREDFTLYEDGEPVDITHFRAVAPPAPSVGQLEDLAGAADPADPPVLLAVFVDNQSLSLGSRNRLLPRLRERLAAGLPDGAKVMVATQDFPGSLNILQPPTADVAAAVAALDATAKVAPGGQLVANNVSRMIREIEMVPAAPSGGGENATDEAQRAFIESQARSLYEEIRTHAVQVHNQAAATGEALAHLVQGLSGLPGRKAILLLSGGLSLHPAQALIDAWNHRFAEQNREWNVGSSLDQFDQDPGQLLRRTAQHANANQVTLYAVGATDVPSIASAALRSNEVWTSQETQTERSNLTQSINDLVGPTGGLASVDAGDPGKLVDELARDLDAYYSLGYTPSRRQAGTRKVRVEVAREGLRVRHRENRRDRSPREVMADRTRAGLLFGWQDNPLQVEVEVGVAAAGQSRNSEVLPVTVKLPMAGLVLVPQGPFHEGRLTIYVAARDESARLSPITEILVPVRVPNEQLLTALGQLATYRTQLEVRQARQTIVVTVRDELGNVASTVALQHPPADPAAADATPPEPTPPARDSRR